MKGLSKKSKVKRAPTPENLVEQANSCLAKMQPELASKFLERALVLAPENTNIMDGLADVYLQIGKNSEAYQLLLNSTDHAPDTNPDKWFYLAQLQNGEQAVCSYQKGIQLMKNQSSIEESANLTIQKHIAKAYCSIAEIYMSDLCYEEGAEFYCEENIKKAMEIDSNSLDAFQALASLKLSQSKFEEASNIMRDVFERLKYLRDKLKARTIIEEMAGAELPSELQDAPETEFCIATAKLLIECIHCHQPHAESAISLISDLMEEDDDNIELWYLYGVAGLGTDPPDYEASRYHLERAKEMMERVKGDMRASGDLDTNAFPFEEQLCLIESHLELINNSAGGLIVSTERITKPELHSKPEVGMADDEEWSTCDEMENEESGCD